VSDGRPQSPDVHLIERISDQLSLDERMDDLCAVLNAVGGDRPTLSAGSGLAFESLGPQRLKGLPEEIDVYRVATLRTSG
jgi:hypothetical protein